MIHLIIRKVFFFSLCYFFSFCSTPSRKNSNLVSHLNHDKVSKKNLLFSNKTKKSDLNLLCKTHRKKLIIFFNSLNTSNPKLHKVKEALRKKKLETACNELLNYFEKDRDGHYLEEYEPKKSNNTFKKSDEIIKNRFTFLNKTYQIPLKKNGRRDWHFSGTENDPEWAWLSNRHDQIGKTLFRDYLRTNKTEYIKYIDKFINEFIIDNITPTEGYSRHAIWRGLEVSYRASNWCNIFYRMLGDHNLSDTTKILMIISLKDHAEFLIKNHKKTNNWVVTEMFGLAKIGILFPEFKQANDWKQYASKTMFQAVNKQVYPDGVQKELSFSYHRTTLQQIVKFISLFDKNNDISYDNVYFNKLITKMYDYIAFSSRPDLSSPLNGDSNREILQKIIYNAGKKYNKKDWVDISSNNFTNETVIPSKLFPWAGHFISRNNFDKDAHWSFFDIGPYGTAHQHRDKLHLSISAYGNDFLVDSGRLTYSGNLAKKFKGYFNYTFAHNCATIDNYGQLPYREISNKPIDSTHYTISPTYDYVSSVSEGFGKNKFQYLSKKVKHRRSMLYLRNKFWLILDNFNLDKHRKIEIPWHWHPNLNNNITIISDNKIIAREKNGNLLLTPIYYSKKPILKKQIGKEDYPIQGWYSSKYNNLQKSMTTIFSVNNVTQFKIIWLILPFKNELPNIKNNTLKIKQNNTIYLDISIGDKTHSITLPINDNKDLLKVDTL